MKRIVSMLVILSMLVAFIPTAFATEGATAPTDVVYDFTTLEKGWKQENGTEGKNFAFNTTGQSGWKVDDPANGNYLKLAVDVDWETRNGTSNKAGIDITVTEDGWYTPSFTGGLTKQGMKASIYLGTTYLGDYDFTTDDESTSNVKCIIGSEKRLNAVYLTAGTHTVWFCFRAGTNGGYPFFINFKLYGLSEEPTITGVNSEVPTEVLSVGDVKNLTARVIDLNGEAVSYADYTADSSGFKAGEDTTNYLEVTSDNESIVKVKDFTKGGLCNSENTSYSIEGVGGGVANLVFTPYIDDVAQTSYTKSVSVAGPIMIDFSKSTDKATSTPGYIVGPYGQSSENWRKSKDNTMMRVTQVHQNYTLWHDKAQKQNMISFKVNVPKAGFYNIKLKGGLTVAGGIMSIYANGNYVGDYDFHTDDTSLNTDQEYAVAGPEKTLNTIYLSSGYNIVFMGLRKSLSTATDTRIFLSNLTLAPVDSLADKNAINIKEISAVDVPTTMTVGDSIDATATITMEDDSVRSFAEYALNGTSAVADTNDSVTVTSSAPEIISVESFDDDALGASDETTFTLKANAAGSADIVVTAKVGESTKTTTYGVTANEYNPNSITTNPTVSVYIGAENADTSLITVSKGGIAAGVVDGTVARGTLITATAESNEDYEFLYWMDNAKRYIQYNETYTFTAGTNTAVFAVYADKTDALKLFDYFTDSGTRVYSAEAEDEASITVPALEMTGYTGGIWKKSIDNAEYVTFTPDWENATKAVASATLNGEDYKTGSYGDKVTVNKTTDAFVAWKKNGTVVSYDDVYTFYMWDALEALVESTEGEKSDFPAVALFKNGDKYMLELVNCENVEIVEKGILFDGTIDSCQKKFVSRTDLSQFTITEDTCTNAKAYVIYRDGMDLRVAYSE